MIADLATGYPGADPLLGELGPEHVARRLAGMMATFIWPATSWGWL